MKPFNKLGISSVHITIDDMDRLGFNRLEVGLGRVGSYEERLEKVTKEIAFAENKQVPYSIHLPIYLYDWYQGDYLNAFYLDPDKDKRELSYRLLEENLKQLEGLNAEYYVLHFQGIYLEAYMDEADFLCLVTEALDRLNSIAAAYDVKLLLEYFGSNVMFSDYRVWTDLLADLSHLGILMDTGHLYYASILHAFDFQRSFDHLCQHAEAFHLWTTKGKEAYAEAYKTYHHISAHPEQKRLDGWAFDTKEVFNKLLTLNKPIVLEGTPIYQGQTYFYESMAHLREMAYTG